MNSKFMVLNLNLKGLNSKVNTIVFVEYILKIVDNFVWI